EQRHPERRDDGERPEQHERAREQHGGDIGSETVLRYGPGMASADLSSLRGQRVLITGAARGIGAALAERLASHGARLALVGLEPERMAAVAARCGEGTFVAECDVSSNEQVTM